MATASTRVVRCSLLIALVASVLGCTSTKITKAEQRPLGRRTMSKWVVAGIAENEITRMRFERVFARRLNERGVDAKAAVDVFGTGRIEQSAVEAKVADGELEAGIVTRVVGQARETGTLRSQSVRVPSQISSGGTYSGGFFNDYNNSWDMISNPGYSLDRDVLRLETVVYDLRTGRKTWSIESRSFGPDDIERVIDEVSKTAIDRLAKDGLIP